MSNQLDNAAVFGKHGWPLPSWPVFRRALTRRNPRRLHRVQRIAGGIDFLMARLELLGRR